MSKSIRIRTTPNGSDKFLKVKLDQDFDFIEILSLKISQEEVYERFCSDYGVVVGRVNVNAGFGVPNARVSIFVPISEEDLEDPEIAGIYPFETIKDKDIDGKRYNLLPRTSKGKDVCHTPVGTFPNKREIIDNEVQLEIYEKYYKYTTVTNDAGDFMIFGVPTGTHMMQVEADLSDIGIISQRPYDLIREGENKLSFDSPNKFKKEANLDTLSQIKYKKPIGINVPPFWGDKDQCEIGIVREDVDLQYNVKPNAIFMGSIFSDAEENSIHEKCKPAKNLGKLCQQVTGEGSIDMIRKTINGKIERFDVEGGRVINDNGAWAYQIPMNLDFMVTNEFGVLVQSDDPNKGIPTRASVRFRIGMDQTGGEGVNRTRAKHLVPHNPTTSGGQDYTFDSKTGPDHFRDLYWNKIYSVKNLITRFQDGKGVKDKTRISIKDVDCGGGTHTEFPFNRLDADLNPLFLILCSIMQINVMVVGLINGIIIPVINLVIFILNEILKLICEVVYKLANLVASAVSKIPFGIGTKLAEPIRKAGCITAAKGGYNNGQCDCESIIPHSPCLTISCGGVNPEVFAPGCAGKGSPIPGLSLGWETAKDDGNEPIHYGSITNQFTCYHDNGASHAGHKEFFGFPEGISGNGLLDCFALELGITLDLFDFDFSNDWINGTLYSSLIEYKKKRSGQEQFCEYDCDDFGGGVNGDNSGGADNHCRKSYLLDIMDPTGGDFRSVDSFGQQRKSNDAKSRILVKSGLIKKFEDNFYYAVFTQPSEVGRKLAATDIIHLGSVFACDWQGIPVIHDSLISTTYKTAPLISQFEEVEGDDGIKVQCGKAGIGKDGSGDGYFFDINCLLISVDTRQASNLRTFCEFGVKPDQESVVDADVPTGTNCTIGDENITDFGALFRSIFYMLNVGGSNTSSIDNSLIEDNAVNTNFGWDGRNEEWQNKVNNNNPSNAYHDNWKGLSDMNGIFKQPLNSYYFYFGIIPGKSALDVMKSRYFNTCFKEVEDDFVILGTVTDVSEFTFSDGAIDVEIIGGTAPYTYEWVGPNGPLTFTTHNPINLIAGSYTVIVQDLGGGIAEATFVVNTPVPFLCELIVFNTTTDAAVDGKIVLDSLVGGTLSNISWGITDSGGSELIVAGTFATVGSTLLNLDKGFYTVTVTDGGNPSQSCVNIVEITGPVPVSFTIETTDPECNGELTGTYSIVGPTGGIPPYTLSTVALDTGHTSNDRVVIQQNKINLTNLGANDSLNEPDDLVLETTVTDSIGQTATAQGTISVPEPPRVTATGGSGCNSEISTLIFNYNVEGGGYGGPYNLFITEGFDFDSPIHTETILESETGVGSKRIFGLEQGSYQIFITDKNGCRSPIGVYNMTEFGDDALILPAMQLSYQESIPFAVDNNILTVVASGGVGPRHYYYSRVSSFSLLIDGIDPSTIASHPWGDDLSSRPTAPFFLEPPAAGWTRENGGGLITEYIRPVITFGSGEFSSRNGIEQTKETTKTYAVVDELGCMSEIEITTEG